MDINISKLHSEKFPDRRFNENLIYSNRNEELVRYIIMVLKDYERLGPYKMKSAILITDERKIDINKFEMEKFMYKKQLKEMLDNTRSIADSRYNLLEVVFEINLEGKTKEKTINLLIPKPYNVYYYLINSNKLYPIYQVVENSTYVMNGDTVVLKTLRTPIRVIKSEVEVEDTKGNVWKLNNFTYEIKYGKQGTSLPPILYFLAKDGLIDGLTYLDVTEFIRILKYEIPDSEDIVVFKLGNSLYCHVDKNRLETDKYLQSIIAMLMNKEIIGTKDGIDILNRDHWIKKLGKKFTTSTLANTLQKKGESSLYSLDISLDFITQENLRLEPENKQDMYAVLRWILQNFDSLLEKDNYNLSNKRVRIAEYLAAEIVNEVSIKLYKLLKESKVDMTKLENALSIKPTHLIYKMQESPLLKYDNSVNDMSVFDTLKYTTKGISTLGNKTNKVPDSYRRIYPSHMGRLDISTSSNGDPGLSGNLCPINNMSNNFFDDNMVEPETYKDNLDKDIYGEGAKVIFKSDFRFDLESCYLNKDNLKCVLTDLCKERDFIAEKMLKHMIQETKSSLIKETKHNTMEKVEDIDPIVNLDLMPEIMSKASNEGFISLVAKKRGL